MCVSNKSNYTCICDYPFYGKTCELILLNDKITGSKFITYDEGTQQMANINLNFFGEIYSIMYISTNGWIALGGSSFPSFNSNVPGIIPFSIDLDTSKGGQIYYREAISPLDLENISDDIILFDLENRKIENRNFYPKRAYIITWDKVSYYSDPSHRHTFQVIIATDEISTFVIFNYNQLESSVTPIVGYNAGRISKYYSYTESSQKLLTESNVGYPGKWIFKVDK